jgi:hypothetical protein
MLGIKKYVNLRLRNFLVNTKKTPIKSINYANIPTKQIWIGSSKIYSGINKPYNISQYQSEIYDYTDIIDYNYNMGIYNNIKLGANFSLEHYMMGTIHNKMDMIYQTNMMNKLIFGDYVNSELHVEHKLYHKNSYKFVYFYQIEREIDFFYKSNPSYGKSQIFTPTESDIICIDNNINPTIYYNDKDDITIKQACNYNVVGPGDMGILVMTIEKAPII